MQTRKIIHIDMDAFYASVEQRDHPEWQGKAVIVGGSPDSRGVVATASYEARKFGVHSAMPSAHARRLCPHGIFVKPHFEIYRTVSKQIREIFKEYTDLIEPLSLDEAYLDVTENKKNNPSATLLAKEIKDAIRMRTRLTASAGVAPNKFLAKIASDLDKPDGLAVITPDMAEEFISKLPIGKFHGIGRVTEEKMKSLGIYNGADLKTWSEADLVTHFGKTGSFYYQIARGIDLREVKADRIRKSIGAEETFSEDLGNLKDMELRLDAIAQDVAGRLEKYNTGGRTVTLKVRYADFQRVTRSTTPGGFMRNAETLATLSKNMLPQTDAEKRKVRLLGITVSGLEIAEIVEGKQLELFEREQVRSYDPRLDE